MTSSHATRQGTLGHSRLSSPNDCRLILALKELNWYAQANNNPFTHTHTHTHTKTNKQQTTTTTTTTTNKQTNKKQAGIDLSEIFPPNRCVRGKPPQAHCLVKKAFFTPVPSDPSIKQKRKCFICLSLRLVSSQPLHSFSHDVKDNR